MGNVNNPQAGVLFSGWPNPRAASICDIHMLTPDVREIKGVDTALKRLGFSESDFV